MVLGIVGGSWLVFDNLSMRDRLSALEAQRRHWDARDQGLVQQLTEAQKRADSLAAQMQKRSSSEEQGAPLVASLFLMAGPSRSEARVPQLVSVAERRSRISTSSLKPGTSTRGSELQFKPGAGEKSSY